MGSLTVPLTCLPKIDLSSEDLSPGTTSWDLVRGDVLQALQVYGCFEAVYGRNKIQPELYHSVMEQLQEVFDLPSETKQRFVEPGKPYFGYVGNLPTVPLYEAMGISGVLDSTAIQDLTNIFWPVHGNPRFCETMKVYAKKVSELELLVKSLVFEGLGVEKHLESQSHVDSAGKTTYSIRLSKYAAPNTVDDLKVVGASTHRDKNFLTLLQQNHVDGLEVETKDGGWIKATPSPSTFIVMVGESFLGWCNGRLQCPRHRVMVRGHETRYSIGLFSGVKGTIVCPKELVDEEHPVLFKPFDEIGLLHRVQLAEDGEEAESALTAYFISA